MPLKAKNRDLALGKRVNKAGKKEIFTTGGTKIASKAGDKSTTNKKGEKVVVRKGGNRVITKADGRIVRIKRDGTRVVSVPSGYKKVPAGLKLVKGSNLWDAKQTPERGT